MNQQQQVSGDGLSMNLAGMSKNQLYDIMSQMKALIEQNQDQARQILIQNPLLTKALFQAQIMLGMLQPPQEIPNIQPTTTQHPQQLAPPAQQSNAQATPLPGHSSLRDQTSVPMPSSALPTQQSNPSLLSHPLPPTQHNRGHVNAQSVPIQSPQSAQHSNMASLPSHYSTQPQSVIQPTLPAASAPLQQPSHISSMPHVPLQPPLPPQPRPPSMPPFPHQNYSHMGPNAGFQHPGAPQLHHSQPMFHSGSRPSTSMGPPFSQGQPPLPNQPPSQALYQGGSSHVGMDYNQMGISPQPERGSSWMPGISDNAAGTQLPGLSQSFLPTHMGPGSQASRPAELTPAEKNALLQQVMSLTQEQINILPPDQRNQVLQLRQMLR
uniref:cleavage stimulating factor 64 n=1 Tax=Erigeron canadensis TaxID=72917 RepID=UPI001CB8EE90|nr:cleavage stimulating factor 64 [Erigeron canadensis]XP_043631908.1 cleavage stimulating factor 64 [Erigeron canadensis]